MATDVDGTPANKTRTHAYKPNVPYLRNLDEVTLDYLVSFNKKRSNFAFEQSEMLSVSRSRRGGEAPPLAAHYTTVIINCRVLCVFTKKKKKNAVSFRLRASARRTCTQFARKRNGVRRPSARGSRRTCLASSHARCLQERHVAECGFTRGRRRARRARRDPCRDGSTVAAGGWCRGGM